MGSAGLICPPAVWPECSQGPDPAAAEHGKFYVHSGDRVFNRELGGRGCITERQEGSVMEGDTLQALTRGPAGV